MGPPQLLHTRILGIVALLLSGIGGIIGGFGGWLFATIAHKAAIYLEPSTCMKRKELKQWSVTIYVGLLTVLGIIIYSTIKSW